MTEKEKNPKQELTGLEGLETDSSNNPEKEKSGVEALESDVTGSQSSNPIAQPSQEKSPMDIHPPLDPAPSFVIKTKDTRLYYLDEKGICFWSSTGKDDLELEITVDPS